MRTSPIADVVVIGSGAGGGTVTHVLANLGIKVTLLEAGPGLNPAKDFKEHMWPYQVDHRGAESADYYLGRLSPKFGWFNAPNGFWEIEGEPYTTAPGTNFRWFRSRILGGRTKHYGRITLRFSDYDYVECYRELAARNDEVTMDSNPYVVMRPEGEWDEANVLDRSAARPAIA